MTVTNHKIDSKTKFYTYTGRDAILEGAKHTGARIMVVLPTTEEDREAGRPWAVPVDYDGIHANEVAYQYRYLGHPATSAAGWGHIYLRSLGE